MRAQPCAGSTLLGSGVAWLPDADGDGRAEVAVGSWEMFLVPHGRTYVLASSDPDRSLTLSSPGWCFAVLDDVDGDGAPELAATTPSVGLFLFGLDDGKSVWRLKSEGTSLAALPDLDGDGAPELLLGANQGVLECGLAAIHSGRTGVNLRPPLEPALPATLDAWESASWAKGCESGLDAAALPDLDGDGAPEMAVHLTQLNEVRVLSTRDGSLRWSVALAQLSAAANVPGGALEDD